MPKINFSEIQALNSDDAVKQWLRETVDRFTVDDPPLLSDCIVHYHNGAAPFVEHLAAVDEENSVMRKPTFRWKIEVLCDEWGNKPAPGDIVERQHRRPLRYKIGQPIPGSVLSSMIADGSYSEQLVYSTRFVVDDRGCIECGFHDAMHLLNLWGVHPNGKPLTSKKEVSGSPVETGDGQVKHVRYHRYMEATKARYESLPLLRKRGKQRDEKVV